MSEENPKLAGSGSVYLVSTADASKVGYGATPAVLTAVARRKPKLDLINNQERGLTAAV
jgi:hypothetical protein